MGCHTLVELILGRDVAVQIAIVLDPPGRWIIESVEMLKKLFVRTDVHLIVSWELMHHIDTVLYCLLDHRL